MTNSIYISIIKVALVITGTANFGATIIRILAAISGKIELHDPTYLTNELLSLVAFGILGIILTLEKKP